MDLTERGDSGTRHPWEVQRFEAYRGILDDLGALTATTVLDVGAGDGWFAEQLLAALPDGATIACWDSNYTDAELAGSAPGTTRIRDRPEPGFDLVLVLDVLEHIGDAERFVTESLRPIAATGTPVLVAVPAYQWLFGAHDVALGHHRRYSRRQLRSLVTPWIDVLDEGSLFTSLLAPRAVQVAAERVRRPTNDDASGDDPSGDDASGHGDETGHGVGAWSGGPIVTTAVRRALAADVALGRSVSRLGIRLPGLSHWAFGTVR